MMSLHPLKKLKPFQRKSFKKKKMWRWRFHHMVKSMSHKCLITGRWTSLGSFKFQIMAKLTRWKSHLSLTVARLMSNL